MNKNDCPACEAGLPKKIKSQTHPGVYEPNYNHNCTTEVKPMTTSQWGQVCSCGDLWENHWNGGKTCKSPNTSTFKKIGQINPGCLCNLCASPYSQHESGRCPGEKFGRYFSIIFGDIRDATEFDDKVDTLGAEVEGFLKELYNVTSCGCCGLSCLTTSSSEYYTNVCGPCAKRVFTLRDGVAPPEQWYERGNAFPKPVYDRAKQFPELTGEEDFNLAVVKEQIANEIAEAQKQFVIECIAKAKAESCHCCSEPCKDWKVTGAVNTCSTCAVKVNEIAFPSVKTDSKEYAGGSYFYSSLWQEHLDKVEHEEHLKKISKGFSALLDELAGDVTFPVYDSTVFDPNEKYSLKIPSFEVDDTFPVFEAEAAPLPKTSYKAGEDSCHCCDNPCKDWESPFDVNVCPSCATTLHNMRSGWNDPDDYVEGDSIDPINWDVELAAVRETIITKALDTAACGCCGTSCKNYHSKYNDINACTTCATIVHQYYSPGVTEDYYPLGDAFEMTTWGRGIELAKAKAEAKAKEKKDRSALMHGKGQEIWVPIHLVRPGIPYNENKRCEQIFVPDNCPTCSEKITVFSKGNQKDWGGLTGSCNHANTYQSLFNMKVNTMNEPEETIDFWVDQSYLGVKEPGYKCKKITLPKKCPGNTGILGNPCGSTFELANSASAGEQNASYFTMACNCGLNNSVQSLVNIKIETPTREEFAENIIAALQGHMYPFGGYLRDKVSGEEFKDIDLYFPKQDVNYRIANSRKSPHLLVVDKLSQAGFKVTSSDFGNSIYVEDHGTLLFKQAYTIEDKFGNKINIDVVNSNAKSYSSESDTPFIALDADVNSLYRDINGNLAAANGYSVGEVQKSILAKTFDMPKGSVVRSDRIQSLLEKGYAPAKLAQVELPLEKKVYIPVDNETGELLELDLNKPAELGNKVLDAIDLAKAAVAASAATAAAILSQRRQHYIQIGEDIHRVEIDLNDAVLLNEKIDEALNQKEPIMFDNSKLCAGDRVLLEIEHDDITYEQEAIVVNTDCNDGLLFCFDESFETDDGSLASFDCPLDQREQAECLGLDPDEMHCWNIDGYTSTVVVKKLPRKKEGANAPEQEADTMINQDTGAEISFFDLLKSEMAEAGLEVTATQLTDGLQAGFMMLLKDRGFDDGELAVVKKMIGSKGGHAVLSWAIGMGIINLNIEGVTDIPAVQMLGKKFRVGGMREIGNEGADIAKKYFMPAIMGMMASLPKITEQAALAAKTRVAEAPGNARIGEHDHDEEVDLGDLQNTATAR